MEHSYVPGNPYKGLHALLRSPAGISTEVQFHSTAGLALKEARHPDYTITRDPDRPLRERLAANQRMCGRYARPDRTPDARRSTGADQDVSP